MVDLTAEDMKTMLELAPPFVDLPSDHHRATYLKFAAAIHEMSERAYLVHVHWQDTKYKVAAIKGYRALTGAGLKEAKEFIESGAPMGPMSKEQAEEAVEVFEKLGVMVKIEVLE